jgi:hypothetical protein
MDSLRCIWKEEPLSGVMKMEPGDLIYYKPDFDLLNLALRVLYHILEEKI